MYIPIFRCSSFPKLFRHMPKVWRLSPWHLPFNLRRSMANCCAGRRGVRGPRGGEPRHRAADARAACLAAAVLTRTRETVSCLPTVTAHSVSPCDSPLGPQALALSSRARFFHTHITGSPHDGCIHVMGELGCVAVPRASALLGRLVRIYTPQVCFWWRCAAERRRCAPGLVCSDG